MLTKKLVDFTTNFRVDFFESSYSTNQKINLEFFINYVAFLLRHPLASFGLLWP